MPCTLESGMRLQDIIRGSKADLDTGKWQSGRIPRTAFPMSRLKDRHYRYGPDYLWRLVRFEAAACSCRILILLNESREVLRARLGVELDGDMVVLSDYEYHATEPGWHCHVTFEDVADVGPGAARQGKRRWPNRSSRQDFAVDRSNAMTVVAEHYKFAAQGELI
jgi:hypothetical protein